MKILVKAICVILLVMTFQSISLAWITDVNIIPSMPTEIDSITILARGYRTYNNEIVDHNFSITGNTLQLDIYIESGGYPTVSSWSYSEEIGTLPAGLYSLTVRDFDPDWPSYPPATRTIEFTVTPEPTTIILLVVGVPVFRRFTRRKKTQII